MAKEDNNIDKQNEILMMAKEEYNKYKEYIKNQINDIFGENSFISILKPCVKYEVIIRSPKEVIVADLEEKLIKLMNIDGVERIRTLNENNWVLTIKKDILNKKELTCPK